MSNDHTPTPEQVDDVLERFTPRQIATAYLRASRRAKDADQSFDTLLELTGLTLAAVTEMLKSENAGEMSGAKRSTVH